MANEVVLTDRLEEVLEDLQARFKPGEEFHEDRVADIRRSAYHMRRLVSYGKVEQRLEWGERLGIRYVKNRYFTLC